MGRNRDRIVACLIRLAQPDDVEGISRVIISALQETNAKDYPEEVIARLAQGFSPAAVCGFLARRLVFVAVGDGMIAGTASLEGAVVRAVFIDPAWQGRGIGRALMAAVERAAVEKGIGTLTLSSSVTAEPFYVKLGFTAAGDSHHGAERTIIMERPLLPTLHGR